ncbi:MAG: hypothetical protein HC877_09185 [Thioploca sp.]|nr:hypothetical protein [Thioploca sp.]
MEEELGTLSFVRKIPNTGFIEDGITRSLLAIRLRSEDPEHFRDLCSKAKELYKEYLRDYETPQSHSVGHLIFIEGLYQELQWGYHQENQDVETRRKLHKSFFKESDGILDSYMEILKSKNGVEKNRMKTSIKEALKADWEFQFTLNFFLRDNAYNDEPYKLIDKKIEDYFN